MFDDKMHLRLGISGKDLKRALHKYGLYDKRRAETKAEDDKRRDELVESFKAFNKGKGETDKN